MEFLFADLLLVASAAVLSRLDSDFPLIVAAPVVALVAVAAVSVPELPAPVLALAFEPASAPAPRGIARSSVDPPAC